MQTFAPHTNARQQRRLPQCILALLLVIFSAGAAPASLSETDRAECRKLAARCRELLQTSVIDFYLPACVDDAQGGYFEVFKAGRFAPASEKFLTLQARQCWLFSTLASADLQRDKALKAARHGYEFLQTRFHDPARGGYFSKVSQEGQPTDRRKHVYLNSFALYALAAYHRASGDPAALNAAQQLFRTLDQHAHDNDHGGYLEFFYEDWRAVSNPKESGYVGAIGIKTYNTHLHLLESYAELYRLWPDPLLRQRLNELITINTSTVLDHDHNCNLDGWHPDWRVVDTPQNLKASYGHDVECAWLVLDAARTLQSSPALYRTWAESLCQTSIQFGFDREHGGFFYTGPLGQPATDRRKEWWVQAEAMVSLLEMLRLTGDSQYLDLFRQTFHFVETYQIAKEGGWWATRQADGSPQGTTRTSMWQGGYHNGRALLLCARSLDALASAAGR